MKIMGMNRNSTSILARKPNRPALRGRCVSVSPLAGLSAPVPETAVADPSSTVVVIDSKVALGSDAGCDAAGSGGGESGFETTIRCAQVLHLKLAALPLILAGSIRYFLPHSSQMTIIPITPCCSIPPSVYIRVNNVGFRCQVSGVRCQQHLSKLNLKNLTPKMSKNKDVNHCY